MNTPRLYTERELRGLALLWPWEFPDVDQELDKILEEIRSKTDAKLSFNLDTSYGGNDD